MNKANKRKEKDVMKLLTSDYEIEIKEDNMSEFTVILDGPKDSPYEGVSSFYFSQIYYNPSSHFSDFVYGYYNIIL